jgi:hypothetical protein
MSDRHRPLPPISRDAEQIGFAPVAAIAVYATLAKPIGALKTLKHCTRSAQTDVHVITED